MRTYQTDEKYMAREALDDHWGRSRGGLQRADRGSEVYAGGNEKHLGKGQLRNENSGPAG